MQGNNQEFMERMNAVDSKIRAYARFFAFKAQFLDEDDLYQEAMLKLYERYCNEPDFLNNNNSYIWCYAAWMMKNALNHEKNMYVKHVVDITETDKGDLQLAGHYPRPEGEAVRSEVRDIAKQMPEQYQTIYNGTIQGFEPQELADLFGISSGALNWRKRNMIDVLKQAWHTPIKDRQEIIRRMDLWPSVLNSSRKPIPITGTMVLLELSSQFEPEPNR